jgi:thiamine pyrophosphokinase
LSIKAIIYCSDNINDQATEHDERHKEFWDNLSCLRAADQERDTLFLSDKDKRIQSHEDNSIFLLAVDRGANDLYRHQIIPDLIIGDMDSINPEVHDHFRELTRIILYPEKKEATDTELALDWCSDNDFRDILIVNDLQGEFAHSLGVVMLLFKARERGIRAAIFTMRELVFLIPQIYQSNGAASCRRWSCRGRPRRRISLIPLSDSVKHISTSGLEYPLDKDELFRYATRGLSNVFVDGEIEICYEFGELLGVMESSFEEIL